MDLLRAWTAGAAVWVAWAVASVLLHLWLLPLGALALPHVRLLWATATTLTGYALVALVAGLAHPHPHNRTRPVRHWAATWTLPALGAPLEAAAILRGPTSAADAAALLAALAALASGAALGGCAARLVRAGPGQRT
ncbi:hypothetical protein [Streptomonospora litoralis]|uniref:Uncharacterized protein n=1 Tax=Streptomonospora litoralis TaxID=2498135 RepID=A0A4P6PZG7_9ACTN|nr:hypothetical protein [Streptomonospora litoralis]QBI53160.1 hypothetical protein EKD16_06815 [Streptomonospora litoralis]